MFKSILVSVLLLAIGVDHAAAENWSNWRGPSHNGVVEGVFPTEWSAEKNIVWQTPMISTSGSTPSVWGDKVFITAAETISDGADDKVNVLQCLSFETGKLLWQVTLGKERPGKHKKASGCNSSPLTDGERVYVYYKSGDFAAVDLDGNVVWHRNLQDDFGEDTLWWDLGTSPILTKNHLVVACVQSGPSYVAAFDPATGKVAWKVDRIMDAPEEANQTYSTPIVVNKDGEELIVVLGADHVTAHQATDGKEVWRVGDMNPEQNKYNRSIASPVVAGDVIVTPYSRGKTLTGISLDGDVLWKHEEISTDVPTPAANGSTVYVCDDKGRVGCLDAKTGKLNWETATKKNRNKFSSSPILAGDKVYVAREDGSVFVFHTKGDHALLATNLLEGFTIATPVFVSGRILIRNDDTLFCIGN